MSILSDRQLAKRHAAHSAGRRAEEIPAREWPVVTTNMLKRASELGPVGKDENALVGSLVRGYVYLCNAIVRARAARAEALRKGDERLEAALALEVEKLEEAKAGWPMTVV